jgi:hypothetical protein
MSNNPIHVQVSVGGVQVTGRIACLAGHAEEEGT